MSEEKKQVSLSVVVEAAKLDPETGKVEVVAGLEKNLIEQLVREIAGLQQQLNALKAEKEEPKAEEDKGEQL